MTVTGPAPSGASGGKWVVLRLVLGKLIDLLLKRSLKLNRVFELVLVVLAEFYSETAI